MNNMLTLPKGKTRWPLVWCVVMALCGLTLMAQQRLRTAPAVTWITMNAPNPPPPLPYAEEAPRIEEPKLGL